MSRMGCVVVAVAILLIWTLVFARVVKGEKKGRCIQERAISIIKDIRWDSLLEGLFQCIIAGI